MAGEAFQQLLDLGSKGGKTAIEGVGLNQDIAQAQDVQENLEASQKVRRHEQEISAQGAADLAKNKQNLAQWGTTDPQKIAAIKATGAFGPDLAKMMEIDPEGTAARVQRAIDLSGHGGMGLPEGWHPPEATTPPERQFSRGVGQHGEPYFTNLSPEELQQEQDTTNVVKGLNPKLDAAEPVSNLQPFTPGETGRVSDSAPDGPEAAGFAKQSPEELLFQGRIDQARAIAEKPERTEAKEKALQGYISDLFNNNPDIHSMRDKMEQDFNSGTAKAKGLDMKDMRIVENVLRTRGKTPMEMTHPGIDKTFYKPWVAPAKPGAPSDQAEPASVVNPGGGTSQQTQVNQLHMLASQKASQNIDSSLPSETQTAYQYAKGKVAREAGPSQVETGGRGEPGAKGVLHDVSDFLEGKGRAGYGESGPVGMAKDIAGFYGPRAPGMILAGLTGGGTTGLAVKGAKAATKIRAIENMFGLF